MALVPERELPEIRERCRRMRVKSAEAAETLAREGVRVGEWVKKWVDQGVSLRSLARMLGEPGFGRETLRLLMKLYLVFKVKFHGNLEEFIHHVKQLASEAPLSWTQLLHELVDEAEAPEPHQAEAIGEDEAPLEQEVAVAQAAASVEEAQAVDEAGDAAETAIGAPAEETRPAEPGEPGEEALEEEEEEFEAPQSPPAGLADIGEAVASVAAEFRRNVLYRVNEYLLEKRVPRQVRNRLLGELDRILAEELRRMFRALREEAIL